MTLFVGKDQIQRIGVRFPGSISINALAAFHDDARYWYFSNLLGETIFSVRNAAQATLRGSPRQQDKPVRGMHRTVPPDHRRPPRQRKGENDFDREQH
jgi:hypothetical protein